MKSYKDYPVLESGRINFSKIGGTLEVPYLCEIQTESYKSFIDKGIEEAFRDIFPIKSNNETMSLEYISSRLDNAKHSFLECKDKDLTYSAPLYATLGLVDSNNGGQMITSEVFMGDIPLKDPLQYEYISGMSGIISDTAQYNGEKDAIGYTFRYFLEGLHQEEDVKILSVDGVEPTTENIKNQTYPISTYLYCVTLKSNQKENVKKLKDYLLSSQGQYIIEKTGYCALN